MIRHVAGWICSITLGMLAVGPVAVLGVCALVDMAPGGPARASLFAVAITALDPFLWTSLRTSATVAGGAAATAVVLGVVAGRLVGGLRGPSRLAAGIALGVAASTPPTILATVAAIAWAVPPGGPGAQVLWWAASAFPGAATGALAYTAAIKGLAPSGAEAARLAGGLRTWRRLAWPLLRPPMAKVAGMVFALTLADPGPPLILGLRRTLGFQMVLGALGEEPFPRLAVLGLIAILACAAVRAGLGIWSGPGFAPTNPATGPSEYGRPPGSKLGWSSAMLLVGSIAATTAAAAMILARAAALSNSSGAAWSSLDFDPGRLLVRSLLLGSSVAAIVSVSWRVAARVERGAGPAASERSRRLSRLLAPPPIVAGIVILALGRLIRLQAAAPWGGVPGFDADEAASWLEGDRAPMLTAILGVCLARAACGPARPIASPRVHGGSRADAAILAGAGRARASRLGRRSAGSGGPLAVEVAADAATNVAPAVLTLSTAATATIGPAVLLLQEQPGGASATAWTALAVWVLCVVAGALRAFDSTRRTARA